MTITQKPKLSVDNHGKRGILTNMSDETLSEQLRAAIRDSGTTAANVASRSGVDAGQISRFLRGERDVTVETAEKLLAALGCSVKIGGRATKAATTNVKRARRRRRKDA